MLLLLITDETLPYKYIPIPYLIYVSFTILCMLLKQKLLVACTEKLAYVHM